MKYKLLTFLICLSLEILGLSKTKSNSFRQSQFSEKLVQEQRLQLVNQELLRRLEIKDICNLTFDFLQDELQLKECIDQKINHILKLKNDNYIVCCDKTLKLINHMNSEVIWQLEFESNVSGLLELEDSKLSVSFGNKLIIFENKDNAFVIHETIDFENSIKSLLRISDDEIIVECNNESIAILQKINHTWKIIKQLNNIHSVINGRDNDELIALNEHGNIVILSKNNNFEPKVILTGSRNLLFNINKDNLGAIKYNYNADIYIYKRSNENLTQICLCHEDKFRLVKVLSDGRIFLVTSDNYYNFFSVLDIKGKYLFTLKLNKSAGEIINMEEIGKYLECYTDKGKKLVLAKTYCNIDFKNGLTLIDIMNKVDEEFKIQYERPCSGINIFPVIFCAVTLLSIFAFIIYAAAHT